MSDQEGSYLLTARAMFETLQISWPTVFDGITQRITVEKCDRRLSSWSRKLMDHAGVTLSVQGEDAVDWTRSYVLMSNHQSHYDIPILYAIMRGTVRMVTKQELFKVPVWGRAMRDAGFISIDRKNTPSALASMRVAADAVRSGINIWLAPEGTRSLDGRLLPFKKGGFVMARDLDVPILPVTIDGSRNILPAGSWKVRRGKHVSVTFGTPIQVHGRPLEDVTAEVRGFLTTHLTGA